MDNEEALTRLFASFDLNHNGYLDMNELRMLCADFALNDDEIRAIFQDLDVDQDGRISKNDFLHGFKNVLARENHAEAAGRPSSPGNQQANAASIETMMMSEESKGRHPRRPRSQPDNTWKSFLLEVGLAYYLLPSDR